MFLCQELWGPDKGDAKILKLSQGSSPGTNSSGLCTSDLCLLWIWPSGLEKSKREEGKKRNARIHSHLGNKVPVSVNPSSPVLGEQWEGLITQSIGISQLGYSLSCRALEVLWDPGTHHAQWWPGVTSIGGGLQKAPLEFEEGAFKTRGWDYVLNPFLVLWEAVPGLCSLYCRHVKRQGAIKVLLCVLPSPWHGRGKKERYISRE